MNTLKNRSEFEDAERIRGLGLLSILPTILFAARMVEYLWVAKTPEQLLWCCHISNLLLALGMIFGSVRLIRVASLWLMIGVPPWILDMVVTRLVTPVSIFSHLGATLIATCILWRLGMVGGTWRFALIYFLILQQVTRLLTAPGPYTNVNVAHFAYGPWRELIPNYWLYILINSVLTAIYLIIVEWILCWLFPPRVKEAKVQKCYGEE